MKLQNKHIETVKEIVNEYANEYDIQCQDDIVDMLSSVEEDVVKTLNMKDTSYVYELIQAVYFNDKEMLDSMKKSLVF